MTHVSSASPHPSSQPSINGSKTHGSVTPHTDFPTPNVHAGDTHLVSPGPGGKADSADAWRYESAVSTIETIIHNIEAGEMELATIFDQFAIAVEHLQACETFLKHHRQQVDLLVETLTDESNF